jgi:hypothetical protein
LFKFGCKFISFFEQLFINFTFLIEIMSPFTKLFFYSLALFCFNSCSNEIDVASPYKEIPTVYGKISSIDSVHFIRIQKGFLSPTISAYEIAKYKDSIYYGENDLDAKLINTANGAAISLIRVNGNDYNFPKDTGSFYSSENILYKINGKLKEGVPYKLACTNKKSNVSFEATTSSIAGFSLLRPTAANPTYTFPKNDTAYGDGIISLKVEGSSGSYTSLDGGAIVVSIEMDYEEWDENNPSFKKKKTVTWVALPYTVLSVNKNNIDLNIKSAGFFQSFANLEKNISTVRSLLPAIRIKAKIVNSTYAKYIEIVNTQASSISSDEALNVYSNIKNGKGLMYSDSEREFYGISLAPSIIDYLACDVTTKKLGFLNSIGAKCK